MGSPSSNQGLGLAAGTSRLEFAAFSVKSSGHDIPA
jgi:hypothetical protein